MRLPIAIALITALALPASASAGTVALEGSELVYRGDAAPERLVVREQTRPRRSSWTAERSRVVRRRAVPWRA